MKTAILIYHLEWLLPESEIVLNDYVKLCKTQGTQVFKNYIEQCHNYKVDDGEPFPINCHIEISDNDEYSMYLQNWHTSYSIISKIMNFLALITKHPIDSYRVLMSNDGFKTSFLSTEIFCNHVLSDNIFYTQVLSQQIQKILSKFELYPKHDFTIHEENKLKMVNLFIKYLELHNNIKVFANALSCFFNAWRSYELEQSCINYTILLESLFSPSDRSNLSKAIAFNGANFLCTCINSKEQSQKVFKKFYSLRSNIVHGSIVTYEKLAIYTGVMHIVCGEILYKILTNTKYHSYSDSAKFKQNLLAECLS